MNHEILTKNLENNFGFRDNAKRFVSNYLSNRYQYTRVSNCRSSLRTVTCRVPQGSALGPLLFFYMLMIYLLLQTLFADDTLSKLSDCNIKKLEKRVNNELNKINVWLRNNKISLNISKTNYMLIDNYINASTNKHFEIKLQQNVLNRVRNVKYLGVLIDDGLNWESHIKQLFLQLSKTSAIIYRLRNLVDTETLKLLYCNLVYSGVQYDIVLWGTATYTRQKEIVLRLNYIVRIMTWSRKFDHVSILYKQLKLLNLKDIYKLELSKFMHQLNRNMTPKVFEKNFVKLENVHSYSTRQKTKNNWLFEVLNCGQLYTIL